MMFLFTHATHAWRRQAELQKQLFASESNARGADFSEVSIDPSLHNFVEKKFLSIPIKTECLFLATAASAIVINSEKRLQMSPFVSMKMFSTDAKSKLDFANAWEPIYNSLFVSF